MKQKTSKASAKASKSTPQKEIVEKVEKETATDNETDKTDIDDETDSDEELIESVVSDYSNIDEGSIDDEDEGGEINSDGEEVMREVDSRQLDEVEEIQPNIIKIVNPEDRKTSMTLTLAECTKLIGIRATHIDRGGPAFVDVGNMTDSRMIALKELYSRRCPLILRRMITPALYEEWLVREMLIPDNFRMNNADF